MKILILIPVALFALACALPALHWSDNDTMFGLRALAVGWSGIFAGVFAWYANFFWTLALVLILIKRPTPALVAGLIAVAVAVTLFRDMNRELPGDEGGVTKIAITQLLPGCYVWFASLASVPLLAFLSRSK
ncbi:MAG: hypothetical protein LAO79_03790 [Acidobacteriia bacterium]|nr:hypothetical protein [Terriglobia bacterium]